MEELKKNKSEAQDQLDALSDEIAALKRGFNKERNDLTSTLASKEESIQELEKQTEELTKKNSQAQNKADELMKHYMHIEDELRKQLQSVECEREGLECKLAVVQGESVRAVDEFFKEKGHLTSTLASKDESFQELGIEMEELKKNKSEA
eukprot:CAMPEP_0201880972 /NCGR_PEP_ID=MMETSP0902-20130614/11421_1 /ASSEMBLY_ACC=CAM_ASM_000551 /TAXON_ID=420261 /ORGANISM="Thalassiosira antarctica, Strain CCMP982" /LENGTH=149 /DNA_ID=CAMNT_0048409087 /DNA_START=1 /DNA_END=447 /DNA_ORIENTATION=+